MPLKLVPPRAGKSPNWTIRGTHHGVSVNRTARTAERREAQRELARIKESIERGELHARALKGKRLGFAAAALSYIRAGGEARYLARLNDYFADDPLDELTQAAIDAAAHVIYPDASPATRNRQVYTPISAILRHAGVRLDLRRPKGAQGEQRTDWLWPEQAFALLQAAQEVEPELRLFLELLLYTGLRLEEGLSIRLDALRLGEAFIYAGKTKNGDPRPVHLTPHLVAALAAHPRGLDRPATDKLFKYAKNGHLYSLMGLARIRAKLPVHCTFHTLRHTWATWLRRYGGIDLKGLLDTGAWRDLKSTARYAHAVVSEEARRADLLPVPGKKSA